MIDIDIADLLPHDGKMVLLDKILDYDQQSLVAETVVRDDGLFNNLSTVPAWLGIEYMAQAVAAHGGLMRYLEGKPINIGLLLGTRRYISNVPTLTVGMYLTVKIERIMEDLGLGVYSCHIEGDNINMSAKLNVYLPDKSDNRVIKSSSENFVMTKNE